MRYIMSMKRKPSLALHFGHPDGVLGRVAGTIMALENRAVNRLVVEHLALGSEDVVLELGCGPGTGLAEAARRGDRVIGVDPSLVMVKQARRRNRHAIRTGKVVVARAPAEDLPFADEHFSCAFGVN